jgi:hypothetical protein
LLHARSLTARSDEREACGNGIAVPRGVRSEAVLPKVWDSHLSGTNRRYVSRKVQRGNSRTGRIAPVRDRSGGKRGFAASCG